MIIKHLPIKKSPDSYPGFLMLLTKGGYIVYC